MSPEQLLEELRDQIRGMWRYRWYLIGVAWLIALPGWAYVYGMPDVYQATAKVSVDTNSLLPSLTRGLTASEDLGDEVGLVSKALLSRPNLEEVARQTDLDLRAQSAAEMEGLITGLQSRVSVRGGRDNIYTISFEDKSRQKASDVVAALLNTFMESSLGAQGDDAEISERAIRLEIEDHEERLLRAEADLAEFKKANIGYMPDNGADYYTRLQAALAAVEDTTMRMRLLRQRRDEIVRQLEGETPLLSASTTGEAFATSGCSKAANLNSLRLQLSALQVDFTDKHPRIVMLKDTISALEKDCDREYAALGGVEALRNADTQSFDANPLYQNLRLQLSDANVELAALQEELQSHRADVARLRADVDKIADVETELKKLNRDYVVIETRHQELLRRWETLQSKKRLDPVTDQVQFNILEPPFAAAAPVAPNRPLLLIAVLVAAFGAGGALVFGLNQLKPVFYRRRTLARVSGIPVLGSVGMILSPKQIAARKRGTVAWAVANLALVVAGVMAVALANPILALMKDLTGSGF